MMKKALTFLTLNFFLFFSLSAQIGWTGNMFPGGGSSTTLDENTDHTIYIQTYKGGVTDGAGQGAGISCEIYYGEVTNFGDPWTNISTVTLSYNVDIGNNDEYFGAMNLSAGKYEYTCRCSDDGGASWSWQGAGDGQVEFTVVLPVELIDFDVTVDEDDIILDWSTASELNNSFFTIEKSTDGENFTEIGTVNGVGNSTEKVDYNFVDTNPTRGINYYRLVQTDYDGTTSYSDVVSINWGGNRKSAVVSLYPNPASSDLIVTSDSQGDGLVQIMNTKGTLVYQGVQTLSERMEIDVEEFSAGLYYIHISKNDSKESIFSGSFIKE